MSHAQLLPLSNVIAPPPPAGARADAPNVASARDDGFAGELERRMKGAEPAPGRDGQKDNTPATTALPVPRAKAQADAAPEHEAAQDTRKDAPMDDRAAISKDTAAPAGAAAGAELPDALALPAASGAEPQAARPRSAPPEAETPPASDAAVAAALAALLPQVAARHPAIAAEGAGTKLSPTAPAETEETPAAHPLEQLLAEIPRRLTGTSTRSAPTAPGATDAPRAERSVSVLAALHATRTRPESMDTKTDATPETAPATSAASAPAAREARLAALAGAAPDASRSAGAFAAALRAEHAAAASAPAAAPSAQPAAAEVLGVIPAAAQDISAAAVQGHVPGAGRSEQPTLPQFPVPTPAGDKAWAEDVGNRVAWMVGRSDAKAELVLTPPSLGKVEVSIQVTGDQTTAHFVAASAAARDALEQALPRLREVLQQAGINLGQANVSTSGEQQAREQSGRQSGRTGLRGNSSGEPLVGVPSSGSSQWSRAGVGLVDTFA